LIGADEWYVAVRLLKETYRNLGGDEYTDLWWSNLAYSMSAVVDVEPLWRAAEITRQELARRKLMKVTHDGHTVSNANVDEALRFIRRVKGLRFCTG